MTKIVYVVELTESVGRYNTHETTKRCFVVDSNIGFFGLRNSLLSIENLVSYKVIHSFPALYITSDFKYPNSSIVI